MSKLFDDKTLGEIRLVLEQLHEPVRLLFFTQKPACSTCREQQRLLEELIELSPKLSLEIHDIDEKSEHALTYRIDKVPATAVIGREDYGIRFYGVTLGYEFSSLLQATLLVGSGESELEPEVETLLQLIDVPVHLEVMVTLTCPFCAQMVHLAHQLAIASPHISADMVESSEFPYLVQRYQVGSVPRSVINEKPAFEGALPVGNVLLEILKAVKPAEYERLEQQLRELHGDRQVAPLNEEHLYDTLIIGAGPAALSAGIYAARKNLDVALLGNHPGGQITNTATIENWPGIPQVSGEELTVMMRNHTEHYPIAERLHVVVERLEKSDTGFAAHTTDGARYKARSVIYCAGKEYRRLNVPGEERFLGHGIAFCATCDAPLFRDKRVAVVGGGNSAFTAARDLIPYAREIHIIDIGEQFIADALLQAEVKTSPLVKLHPRMRVREFIGQETLSGIRIEALDGSTRQDLPVEGVFLEIGLLPNSTALKALVPLNGQGEVPVRRDQSTEVPGLFAAGDVTDEPEKQIVVAAGAGAKAALSAYRYLQELKEGS